MVVSGTNVAGQRLKFKGLVMEHGRQIIIVVDRLFCRIELVSPKEKAPDLYQFGKLNYRLIPHPQVAEFHRKWKELVSSIESCFLTVHYYANELLTRETARRFWKDGNETLLGYQSAGRFRYSYGRDNLLYADSAPLVSDAILFDYVRAFPHDVPSLTARQLTQETQKQSNLAKAFQAHYFQLPVFTAESMPDLMALIPAMHQRASELFKLQLQNNRCCCEGFPAFKKGEH
jgi:hypothetical protein